MPATSYPMRFGRTGQRGMSERVPAGGLPIFDRMLPALTFPTPRILNLLLLIVN